MTQRFNQILVRLKWFCIRKTATKVHTAVKSFEYIKNYIRAKLIFFNELNFFWRTS
jgi:hypothetical protein